MKNNNNFNSLISDFENYFRSKKSKRLHDPIFFGNETKYLKECISSGFVSYVGNFVNIFENKISNYTKSKYSIATSSGTAALHLALNYYNIDNSLLEYITDSSEHKQNKYTPLTRIPIVGDEIFASYDEVYALILSWNISDNLKTILKSINPKIKFITL